MSLTSHPRYISDRVKRRTKHALRNIEASIIIKSAASVDLSFSAVSAKPNSAAMSNPNAAARKGSANPVASSTCQTEAYERINMARTTSSVGGHCKARQTCSVVNV